MNKVTYGLVTGNQKAGTIGSVDSVFSNPQILLPRGYYMYRVVVYAIRDHSTIM